MKSYLYSYILPLKCLELMKISYYQILMMTKTGSIVRSLIYEL